MVFKAKKFNKKAVAEMEKKILKHLEEQYGKAEAEKICSICFGKYKGFGNNAEPINSGRCCDKCNNLVIIARLNKLYGGKK